MWKEFDMAWGVAFGKKNLGKCGTVPNLCEQNALILMLELHYTQPTIGFQCSFIQKKLIPYNMVPGISHCLEKQGMLYITGEPSLFMG